MYQFPYRGTSGIKPRAITVRVYIYKPSEFRYDKSEDKVCEDIKHEKKNK